MSLLLDSIDSTAYAGIVRWQEANDRHQQQTCIEFFATATASYFPNSIVRLLSDLFEMFDQRLLLRPG